ncbi:hypothetical protein GCM10009677_52900 [Sphaerisporangium rubeum]|uniref:Anti-sigma regulatory factor (Ser/Thr protein kinase) n=1 Tax=Sphaerisporangium rubeum TaxID=321317 RepID=A0A7X0II05_9ACTN|nr:anti-sigma regulatory factor (Ser/Thr protein kinase) [Sphaerisporangium rubeum]
MTKARTYVRSLLPATAHPTLNDIELLTGELVANAVKHSYSGRTPNGLVRLHVFDTGPTIQVLVLDQGPATPLPPIPKSVDPLSEDGRGLWLVQELSSSWGWEPHPMGGSYGSR